MYDLSVIMPTYNDDIHSLQACIDSVLFQTFKDFELLIVTEPDETNIDFLKHLSREDIRVKVIQNASKVGVSGSRNIGIVKSTGKYISFIDGDDICDLKRFKTQLKFLESNPDVSIVGSNMYLIDEENNIIGERIYPETHENIKRNFLLTMSIANPTIMMRREDVEETGFFNGELAKAEDFELWLKCLAVNKKMHNIQEKMLYYRVPAKHNEKRGRLHWGNNYIARKKYGKSIWPLHQRVVSQSLFYIASRVPDVFIDKVINMKLSHKIRNIRINC